MYDIACELARDVWYSVVPALDTVAFMNAARANGMPDDWIVTEVKVMNQAIIDSRNRVCAFVAIMVTLSGFYMLRATRQQKQKQ